LLLYLFSVVFYDCADDGDQLLSKICGHLFGQEGGFVHYLLESGFLAQLLLEDL
jgi:hypothetical protein